MKNQQFDSIMLINKPINWSSFDVVKKIRSMIKKKHDVSKIKVGHSGTLDPLASGLLIICTGKKTKEISKFEKLDKTYIGTLKLGCITDSFDAETEEKNHKPYAHISIDNINHVFSSFLGVQKQTPPIFSALKINGERLYKKARRGERNINLKKRNIIIQKLKILKFNPPLIEFSVTCSKGTYIRTLAHDIGEKLQCGGYLSNLIRTKIGKHQLNDSIDMKNVYDYL